MLWFMHKVLEREGTLSIDLVNATLNIKAKPSPESLQQGNFMFVQVGLILTF